MRKLAIAVVLLIAGCASRGYRGTEGGYTLYRSRMMSPEGVPADEPLDRPGGVEAPPDLFEAYDVWRP